MKWRRPSADRVTQELVEALRARDRGCVLARIDPEHGCRDQWGMPHAPTDLDRLTVEHVHEGYGMKGKRAASDLRHTLLLCAAANVGVPSKVERTAFREYLRRVNEAAWRCDWRPDEFQPAEEGCPYCAGRMCARFDGLNCRHDRAERHGYAA